MRRCSFSFFTFLLSIMLLTAGTTDAAPSLNDLRQQFAEYQRAPLDRADKLRRKIDDTRNMEEGMARQFDVPVTQVLMLENNMADLITFYQFNHYQQKHIAQNNFFTGDELRMRELLEAKPPYSFLFYISFIEELQNHSDELTAARTRHDELKQILTKNADNKLEAERCFRLYSEQLSGNPRNRPHLTWKLMETEIQLEQAAIHQTIYAAEIKICDSRIEILEQRLSMMESMRETIRKNLRFERYDFIYLDSRVYQKSEELNAKLSLLNDQYNYLDLILAMSTRPSDVIKYIVEIESGFLHQEVRLILNMIEDWHSTRIVWRACADLVEGKFDTHEKKELLANTMSILSLAEKDTEKCVELLQRMRELENETQRRFSDLAVLTDDEQKTLVRFYADLEARKNRYLGYILDLGTTNSRFSDLRQEITNILYSDSAENEWTAEWGHWLSLFMNSELWYFDDYPITVRKITDALIIFFVGLLITHYLTYLIRRRLTEKSSMTKHNRLLIGTLFYYLGIIISFVVALWSLHVPLTAFAFLGGAMAIALGFGTQRIMGDMFSGIILLFQKKLRIGDTVIIDNELGIVKEITLQNTVIRSKETLNHIFPNRKILDSHIVNLTLNTTIMRMEIDITINANSSIDEATIILDNILKNESQVLPHPPHKILFTRFANIGNALTAIFFVDMASARRREIASKLRYQILKEFDKAGIGINRRQAAIVVKDLAGTPLLREPESEKKTPSERPG